MREGPQRGRATALRHGLAALAPKRGLLRRLAGFLVVGCVGCAGYEEGEPPPEYDLANIQQASVSCDTWTDTGYKDGAAFTITLVTVDGKPAELNTANAYVVMQQAAAAAGVDVRVVSGFRTWAEQDYLYGCYVNCSCNNCNQAAPPGYSNHQSGHALDLNTSSSGVLTWLNNHGSAFGFSRTVPSENWHWEWWGGGPGGGPCNGGNTATACTLATGETGTCMDTGSCAALGGSHVSTPGYCPGPSNIQCCTGSTACTLASGVSGECLDTAACTALGGSHTSSAGYCPGPSNYQCCTGSTPCTLGTGVAGECLDEKVCAALGNHVSTAGLCPGSSNVQCCTPEAPPPGPDAGAPGPDASQEPDAGAPALDAAEPQADDAGEAADAGVAPPGDAALGDAGASAPPGTVGSGCGCGATAGGRQPWWLALLLVAVTVRASRPFARGR